MNTKTENHAPGIPNRRDWGSLDDHDVNYAFALFGGKSLEEAMPCFIEHPIERAGELRVVPWEIFSYYIIYFVDFLTSDESKGESDCASCFLRLILEKARTEPQNFKELYARLKSAIDTVTGRQSFYRADPEIYGQFLDIKKQIRATLA